MSSFTSTVVHAGPFELPGNGKGLLTKSDRDYIHDATGCSAAVRKRNGWAHRMLTVSGPAAQIDNAVQLATDAIMKSQRAQDDREMDTPGAEYDDVPPYVSQRVQVQQHQQRYAAQLQEQQQRQQVTFFFLNCIGGICL